MLGNAFKKILVMTMILFKNLRNCRANFIIMFVRIFLKMIKYIYQVIFMQMQVMLQGFIFYLKNVIKVRINVNQRKSIKNSCKILTYNHQFISIKLDLNYLIKFHCFEILFNLIGCIQLRHIMDFMVKLLLFKKIHLILKTIYYNMDKAHSLGIFLDYRIQCLI